MALPVGSAVASLPCHCYWHRGLAPARRWLSRTRSGSFGCASIACVKDFPPITRPYGGRVQKKWIAMLCKHISASA